MSDDVELCHRPACKELKAEAERTIAAAKGWLDQGRAIVVELELVRAQRDRMINALRSISLQPCKAERSADPCSDERGRCDRCLAVQALGELGLS